MGHWGTCPLVFQQLHFSSLWSKSESQLSKYCTVCEISWCRCQQLTAFSISTALVTKPLVIEQLLQPALKFVVSAHDLLSSFAPPRNNKSWRRHYILESGVGLQSGLKRLELPLGLESSGLRVGSSIIKCFFK